MKTEKLGTLFAATLSVLLCPVGTPVHSQTPFYQGKTVTIIQGTEPGGSSDMLTRAMIPFMQKHIPGNPTVISEYMPGGASGMSGVASSPVNFLYSAGNAGSVNTLTIVGDQRSADSSDGQSIGFDVLVDVIGGFDATGGGTVKRFSHTRHQWPKVVDVIRPRNHENNCNSKPNWILLILDSLIYGEKNIEFLSGTLEQRPVFDPRPAHFIYGANVVAREIPSQSPRYTLIQQHAHSTPEFLWPAPKQPPLARESH